MPKLPQTAVHALALAVLLGSLPSPGAASEGRTLWQWTTDDGVVSFTDDEKQIPARYRERARSRVLRGLHDYERFTPAETPQAPAPSPRLPAVSAPPPTAPEAPATGEGTSGISIRTGGVNSPIIDLRPEDEGPIVIEQQRAMPDGGFVTRTNTIIRQGDRVITIIKPQANEHNVNDFADEDDLE